MKLLPILEDQAFVQETDRLIRSFCGDVTELTYVGHGADNMVALVNQTYVFRFPRGEHASKRLRFEAAILQRLEERVTSLHIPKLLQVHQAPLYSIASYVPGDHFSDEQVRSLTQAEQSAIGTRLADFIVQFNQVLSGQEVQGLRKDNGVEGLDEPWEAYFARLFSRERLPDDSLSPFIREHYSLWQQYVAAEQRTYAIHDDLHQSNLLFRGTTLQGVLDFGDTNRGGIEEEMRWLYAMGDTVLWSAIEQYNVLTGRQISYEHVREWAIMHELSTLVSRLNRHDTQSFPFQRAQAHLRAWLSGFPL